MKKQRKLIVGDIVTVPNHDGGYFSRTDILRITKTYGARNIDMINMDTGEQYTEWKDDGRWFILKYDFNDYTRLNNL